MFQKKGHDRFNGYIKFFLDTESKVKIYLYLLAKGSSTYDSIAEGTSIYPSTCKILTSMEQMKIVEKSSEDPENIPNLSFKIT